MRVAVISDIHGFILALDSVLEDVDRFGPFDHIVVAGDLCEGGPAPTEVLKRLHRAALPCVMGNTDRDIAAGTRSSPVAAWTRERIGDAGVRFLAELPFAHRIKPEADLTEDDDLLVVHANPRDLDRHIEPDVSDRAVRDLLGETRAGAIAFGHLHVPYIRHIDQKTLVDVSSVGNPKDGDLRSAWGDLTWNDERSAWEAQIRRVDYPIDDTIEQIQTCGMPRPEKLIKSLLRASY